MVVSIEVSRVVWLRKRLSRAKLAIRVAGAAVAFEIVAKAWRLAAERLQGLDQIRALALAIIFAGLVLWGTKRLAGSLRKGSRLAAKMLMLAFVPYVFWAAYVTAHFALEIGDLLELVLVPFIDFLHFAIWVGPIYFIVRGLLAFLAIDRLPSDAFASSQIPSPFEIGVKVLRPSAFPKKRVVVVVFLIFLTCHGLFMFIVGVPFLLLIAVNKSLLGGLFFFAFGAFPLVCLLLWYANFYRAMRRLAVANSTDMLRTHDRPPVLYLRSFGDDTLKLRARPVNGRIWLEALWRVRFEEVLVDHLFRYGPVVAIGRPLPPLEVTGKLGDTSFFLRRCRPLMETFRKRQGDGKTKAKIKGWIESACRRVGGVEYSYHGDRNWGQKPPIGAAREYLPDDAWRARVSELMDQSLLIVLVMGRTEGLSWEVEELAQRGHMKKVLFVMPPTKRPDLLQRWTYLRDRVGGITDDPTEAELRRIRAILLPNHLDPASRPLFILSEARDDWSYEAALDAAAGIVTAYNFSEAGGRD